MEELADTATNKSEEDLKEMDDKLKVFAKEMRKVKTLPMPGSRKSDFKEDIRNSFAKLLPPQMLTRLTPNRCGLCHEDFTSERYAWKHYTGFNHKRTVRYFINGTYKDHPSFYNMVLDAIYFQHPEQITEKQIFDYIKKEHPVGENDARSMNLIRQRGISRLLQIEYVDNQDGKFTATQALINRKKRSKHLSDRTESMKYPEPVKLQAATDIKCKEKEKKPLVINSDIAKFPDQIFDFSKKDLPKSVIDTLTPANCGLCQLDIFCKPWSHYTGAGHRTTVELYQSGSYLGHPPYPTMVDRYIKEVKPATLNTSDILKFLKKNFNIGEDMEKIQARVEKCVEMLEKKDPALAKMKNSASTKMKLPSDNLVWFKKDASKDLNRTVHLDKNDKKLKAERSKDDLRSHLSGRGRQDPFEEHQHSDEKNQSSSKRKSSPGYQDRDRYESHDKSRISTRDSSRQLHASHFRRSDLDHRQDQRLSERTSRVSDKKQRSPDRHRRSDGKSARSPYKRRSNEKNMTRTKRSPSGQRYGRSPRRTERSPNSRKTSSKSSQATRYVDQKRSRRSSRSDQGNQAAVKNETSHSSRSPKETAGRSSVKYSYSKDVATSKSPQRPARQSSSRSLREEEASSKPPYHRPRSGDPLSKLTNPSPPPDFQLPAPTQAISTTVTQSQMPFPGSFLTQHPQFPHVFILNTMGSQMGGQMMMPVPMGQHPPPNQPPTL